MLDRLGRSCDSTICKWSDSHDLVTPRSDRVACGRTKEPPPIREAAFASLGVPLRPVLAPVDPTDASEEREATGRRRIPLYDSRKTTARPARKLVIVGWPLAALCFDAC